MSGTTNKPFPMMLTLISLFCVVTMLILGFWQLDRKQQKETRLSQVSLGEQSEAITIREALADPITFQDFTVNIEGRAADNIFYIDNKIENGQPGFYILQAVNTTQGTVMVNLGWVAGEKARSELPSVETMQGNVALSGMLSIPTTNVFIEETNDQFGRFPVLLQQIDLTQIAQHLDRDILPFIVLAAPDTDAPFTRNWQPVVMAPEKHLGYAIQWFGLAIAALTIYLLSLGKYYKQVNPLDP